MTTASESQLAVAISLYNRWDELQGLLELLRLNWASGNQLFIVVSSTAEEHTVPDWVDRSLADAWLFGSSHALPQHHEFSFLKQTRAGQWLYGRQRGNQTRVLRTRTVDSIQRGCRLCLQSPADYTLHVHAAAWPLKESAVYDILAHTRERQATVAVRGLGKQLVDGKHPAGDIDDNFFFIDNEFARQVSFWDFDPAADADRVSNEGRLARRVYQTCDDSSVYYFDDFSRPDEYLFPLEADQRRVQPYNYHKPTGLLRSHDMQLQAQLCAQFGYRGPFLDKLIQQELQSIPTAHS